jgi:uncharacterized membrane protein YhaH (DUF805 family)
MIQRIKNWFLRLHEKNPEGFIALTGLLSLTALVVVLLVFLVIPMFIFGMKWLLVLLSAFVVLMVSGFLGFVCYEEVHRNNRYKQ